MIDVIVLVLVYFQINQTSNSHLISEHGLTEGCIDVPSWFYKIWMHPISIKYKDIWNSYEPAFNYLADKKIIHNIRCPIT